MSIKRRSRNGAFLIELLTVIAIFAVCAAACVRVIGIAASEMKYAERLSDAQIKTAELSQRYADGDIRIQLSERTTGNIQYLDITASDDENTYITITSARRVAS